MSRYSALMAPCLRTPTRQRAQGWPDTDAMVLRCNTSWARLAANTLKNECETGNESILFFIFLVFAQLSLSRMFVVVLPSTTVNGI